MTGPANRASDLELGEHIEGAEGGLKRVASFGYDGSSYQPLKTNTDGELVVNTEPTSLDIEGGGVVSVGTAAVEMTFTGATKSIIITSYPTNTGLIFVGESNVTNAGANSLTVLQPSESLTLDVDDSANAIYAVSDTAAQLIIKGALV